MQGALKTSWVHCLEFPGLSLSGDPGDEFTALAHTYCSMQLSDWVLPFLADCPVGASLCSYRVCVTDCVRAPSNGGLCPLAASWWGAPSPATNLSTLPC